MYFEQKLSTASNLPEVLVTKAILPQIKANVSYCFFLENVNNVHAYASDEHEYFFRKYVKRQ